MASARGRDLGRVGAAAVASATILVLIALAIVPFLNSAWIGLAQERADAAGWTGWPSETVQRVTDSLLHDLVVGPPDFAVEVAGQPAFSERERGHMRDVRAVFAALLAAAVAGALVLAAAWRTRRRDSVRRAVAVAARLVAIVVLALGVVFAVAFDWAFELFHRLFFPAGSYAFDPATDRLVQLLPGRLWYETSLAFGAALLLLSTATWALARGRR